MGVFAIVGRTEGGPKTNNLRPGPVTIPAGLRESERHRGSERVGTLRVAIVRPRKQHFKTCRPRRPLSSVRSARVNRSLRLPDAPARRREGLYTQSAPYSRTLKIFIRLLKPSFTSLPPPYSKGVYVCNWKTENDNPKTGDTGFIPEHSGATVICIFFFCTFSRWKLQ